MIKHVSEKHINKNKPSRGIVKPCKAKVRFQSNVILYDYETTGFIKRHPQTKDPIYPDVIQFAFCHVTRQCWATALTKPRCDIPKVVQNLTGIRWYQVRNKLPYEKHLPALLHKLQIPVKVQDVQKYIQNCKCTQCVMINDDLKAIKILPSTATDHLEMLWKAHGKVYLIAHNGQRFDHPITRNYLKRGGIVPHNVAYIDSITLLKHYKTHKRASVIDNLKRFSLGTIHKSLFGTDIPNSHDARGDVKAMQNILLHVFQSWDNMVTYIEKYPELQDYESQ